MDLVQVFKVDLVHREGISAMRSRLGCTAIPKRPGAEKERSAPGSKENRLPRVEKGRSAPGSRENRLPRVEKGRSAPGSKENRLHSLSGGQGGISGGVPGTPIMALKGF